MVDVVDVYTRQKMVVTECLTAEDSTPTEIHICLKTVHEENATDVSSYAGFVIL
jgi:hypothetical protein